MNKLPKEQNKDCNIPCIFGKTKKQLIKESNKLAKKFSKLNSTQTVLAEKQPLNKIFA